ncbi:unnamed protein product [Meloidogyne enterolobii]|uniref:Uncharacterized protein n=1 Tax=Meloidogyne enterolobii TaxID=390850 RepID=A0ACB0YWU9_MELEN
MWIIVRMKLLLALKKMKFSSLFLDKILNRDRQQQHNLLLLYTRDSLLFLLHVQVGSMRFL